MPRLSAPSPPPSSLPLGKSLASTGTTPLCVFAVLCSHECDDKDKKTRDKAVRALTAFLSDGDNAQLPEKEMAKLWKGIFYCQSHI